MNSRTARITKEARALFWPWCAVTFAGLLNWLPSQGGFGVDFLRSISPMCFWIGLPLVATLSLGNEFQHGTLSLLLTQPIDRKHIWAEKSIVLIVASLSVGFVYWFSSRALVPHETVLAGGMWVMVCACSAMFWTLVTRSTIGGLILNVMHGGLIGSAVVFIDWLLGPGPSPRTVAAAISIGTGAVLGYGFFMLWLGRRKLIRFQATGTIARDDLFMTTPRVMRGVLAGLLSCRPTGAVVNLIRKEVRLLEPVWTLTLLAVLFMILMTPFQFMSQAQEIAFMVYALYALLVAILAGSVSMGEERTSGTHSWHMTLPVSIGRQWLIKLAVAILVSLSCTSVVWAVGRVLIVAIEDAPGPFFFLLLIPSLTIAAFWCACAVRGTVPAVFWLFPAFGAVFLAVPAGILLGFRFRFRFMWDEISFFHPFLFDTTAERIVREIFLGRFAPLGWAGPLLLLALIQSYRTFRREVQESVMSVLRPLLPLALASFFIGGFSSLAFRDFSYVMISGVAYNSPSFWMQMGTALREAHEAVGKMQLDLTKMEAARPKRFSVEDVANAVPLSERTRRWLAGSTITVAPTAIHLRSGWKCTVTQRKSLAGFRCELPGGKWRMAR